MSSRSTNNNSNPAVMLNVEKFIQDVESRPAIWNRNYHCNKRFLEFTWIELSKMYKLPCTTLKAKWKGLRDNFRVEYKRIPRDDNGDMIINPEDHDSKWAHYQPLLFLVDHMRHRIIKSDNNLSNVLFEKTSLMENNDDEECVVEPDLAHGLVHNDYTSDGQMDDEFDFQNISENCIPIQSLSLIKSDTSVKKRKKQQPQQYTTQYTNCTNDQQIDLTSIKTEPNDTNSTRKSAENYCASSYNNGSVVSKLKLRKVRRPTTSDTTQAQQALINDNTVNMDCSNNDDETSNGGNLMSCNIIEKPTTMAATSSTNQQQNGDRNDDDYHYLMSLHPYMNKLQPPQKLRVRTKIQKLILKELYKEDLD